MSGPLENDVAGQAVRSRAGHSLWTFETVAQWWLIIAAQRSVELAKVLAQSIHRALAESLTLRRSL